MWARFDVAAAIVVGEWLVSDEDDVFMDGVPKAWMGSIDKEKVERSAAVSTRRWKFFVMSFVWDVGGAASLLQRVRPRRRCELPHERMRIQASKNRRVDDIN